MHTKVVQPKGEGFYLEVEIKIAEIAECVCMHFNKKLGIRYMLML